MNDVLRVVQCTTCTTVQSSPAGHLLRKGLGKVEDGKGLRVEAMELTLEIKQFIKRKRRSGFPGDSVVKNPPASAEDTGFSP